MFTNNSGYTKLSRIIIVSFVLVFLIFTVFTYFLVQSNIKDETLAAMKQAKAMQQSQVSIESMQQILSNSPHLKIETFFGRLSSEYTDSLENNQTNSEIIDKVQAIVMPLSENSYLIISPDNDTEFAQNMTFFYLVAALFLVTLAMLLVIIRLGVQHQLRPLSQLAKALQETLTNKQIALDREVELPHSDMQEIQDVFDEFTQLKQSLIEKEIALVNADRKVAMLQEQERSYLARELHDNVGQLITSTKAYAHILVSTEDKKVIKDCSTKIKTFCAEIGSAIRELTHHLHPIILDKVTLWEAVEKLVADQKQLAPSINWEIIVDCSDFVSDKERDIHLYRIIQESINNIIKHSNAAKAKVSAIMQSDTLSLCITDDGKGIDEANSEQGLGLSSISTRARCIGADLNIKSDKGTGTKITLNVRLHAEKTSNVIK